MPVAAPTCEGGRGAYHPSPVYPGYDLENLVFELDEDPELLLDRSSAKDSSGNFKASRTASICSLTIRQSKSDSILLAYEHYYQGRQGSYETSLFSQQTHLQQEQRYQQSSGGSVSFFCGADCDSQGGSFQPDSNMLTIEDLKSYNKSCATCGVSWFDEHVSLDCGECGGYALERPCPKCDGQCLNVWNRDLDRSHSTHKAQWEGTCSTHQQQNQVACKQSEPNLRLTATALHDKLAAPL